jgi:hypothetical protein
MSPYRFDLHDPSSSDSFSFPVLRSRWPYSLGALAGPVFGLSVLLFLAAALTRGNSGETASLIAVFGAVLAGVLLGIAWLGALRNGHGGAGPIAGSFAFPLTVTYLCLRYLCLGRGSNDLNTAAALVAGAVAAFAWGHVAAPCGAVVRGLAAVSAMVWTFLFIAIVRRWDVPNAVVILSLFAVSLTSISLVFSFLRLQHTAPRHAAYSADPDWD